MFCVNVHVSGFFSSHVVYIYIYIYIYTLFFKINLAASLIAGLIVSVVMFNFKAHGVFDWVVHNFQCLNMCQVTSV